MKLEINKIEEGMATSGEVLITKIDEKTTRTGKPYVEVTVCDGSTVITAKEWDTQKANVSSYEGKVACVAISCKMYNGSKDYLIDRIKPAEDNVTITDFIKKAPLDPEYMYNDILKNVKSTVPGNTYGTLAQLVANLYENNREKLMTHGAASGVHHNYYAGLLYHTYRMVRTAKALLAIYDGLDAELLVCATAIHDIGKLVELDTDEFGTSTYSIDGRLFGHAVLGIEMIDEEARINSYPEDRVRCLKHCIAAHHGKLEWGAATLPHIKEAAVLHEIDMLDSRIEIFDKATETVDPGTMSDARVNALGNITPYVPQNNSEQDDQLSINDLMI